MKTSIFSKGFLYSITIFMVIIFPWSLRAQQGGLADETRFEDLEEKIRTVKNSPIKVEEVIGLYVLKARREKRPEKLYRAHVLGTIYAENRKKLAYADSMLFMAEQIGRPDLMGDAFMTNGMLHELNENYNVALTSYVQAQKNLSIKNDPYLTNVLNLNVARIRNYLGQNKEARLLLTEALDFFRENHKKIEHTDYRDYYMHSLIALLDTHSKLGEFADNKKLVTEGVSFITTEKMPQFRAYFVGSEGIDAYYRKNYPLAISKLERALTLYADNWKHLTEKFYLGMSYYKAGNQTEALRYLQMLDEEFEKTGKIDPQFRPAFETLYEYHKNAGNVHKQLEYVNKLLEINTLYEKNYKELFQQLSSRYDNKLLQDEKEHLQNQLDSDRIQSGIITGVSLLIAIVSLMIAFRHYRRRNYYKKLYEEFAAIPTEESEPKPVVVTGALPELHQIQTVIDCQHEIIPEMPAAEVADAHLSSRSAPDAESAVIPRTTSDLNPLLVEQILERLKAFEHEKGYLKKNLTLTTLAAYCGTNSSYLSKVINQHMGQNFNGYLNSLRLDEVIHLWKSKPKTRQLSIQETALKLGYSTAQSFSKNFQERYHISPTYFLKRLNSDVPLEATR